MYNKKTLLEKVSLAPDCDKQMLAKLFKDRIYGKVEYMLLETLYLFPVLNKHAIKRAMDHKLKERSWKDYSRLMEKVIGDGCIYKWSYGNTFLYELAPQAREYMEGRLKLSVTEPSRYPYKLLEQASLAQWHVSLLCDVDCRKSAFSRPYAIGGLMEPVTSYVEIKKGKYCYKIISIAFPKVEEEMKDFLNLMEHTLELRRFMQQRKGTIMLLVICASTLQDIENAALFLGGREETKGKRLYFVLDANTATSTGLEKLYYLDTQDGKKILNTISIKDE